MEIRIAKIIVMKIQLCATTDLVIPTLNLHARMDVVFLSYGCVISTMIVVMIQMNQHTCVVKRIAQQDGEGVPVRLIIDVYLNGCSVMAKTTVEMVLMKCQKTVPLVMLKLISLVKTNDAFRNNGFVISLMIAETVAMKQRLFASISTENVRSLSSNVVTENVFHQDGGAITKMIVVITQMRLIVAALNARMERSSVNRGTV